MSEEGTKIHSPSFVCPRSSAPPTSPTSGTKTPRFSSNHSATSRRWQNAPEFSQQRRTASSPRSARTWPGVELRVNLLPKAAGVLILADGAAQRHLHQAPGGGERLVRAAGPAARLGPGDGDGLGVEARSGEVGGLHLESSLSFRPDASLKHPSAKTRPGSSFERTSSRKLGVLVLVDGAARKVLSLSWS